MAGAGVDTRALKALSADLEKLLEEAPELRREYHEDVMREMERAVRDEIDRSEIDDSRGHVKSWQAGHVGSGGGYAAIRPIGSREGAATGPDSPGAVTNYLEHGHRNRDDSFTPGRHFYSKARAAVEVYAIRRAEGLMDAVRERVEGGHDQAAGDS